MQVAVIHRSTRTRPVPGAGQRLRSVLGLSIGACVLASAACHPLVSSGRAPSFLVIDRLEAASGADPQKFATVLQSDVQTCKKGKEGEPPQCGIFEDAGRVSMRIALKDVGTPESPTQPTTNNLITVTHYKVVYRRSDGRNQPGVDVPYGFDGGATFTVDPAGVTGVFVAVRANAKLEAPLIALVNGGGALGIYTTADITFYGHDQTGSPVTATGSMSVNFADWADPES